MKGFMEEKKIEKVVPIRRGEEVSNVATSIYTTAPKKPESQVAKIIRRTVAWFNIFMMAICTFGSVLNIWTDNSLSDVMSKAWATFLVLGFFSLVIVVLAPLLDKE